MSELSAGQRRIVNGTRNAARLLLFGGLCAIAVLVAKVLSRSGTISVAEMSVPVRDAWVLFAALTAAHLFVGGFLAREIREYLGGRPSAADRQAVLDEITAESNPFVHSMIPRVD